ncbi:hypothetical protein JHK87_004582 [Glycine soja]|nr:hypothetical protein JHK87_004582 [Glycine soja]
MQCYWIPSGTPQTRCPLPDVEEANKPKGKKNKIAITFINLDTSSLRNNMNPSKVFDLNKMDERDFVDHVMQVHEALKSEREKWEKAIQAELIATQVKEAIAHVTEVLDASNIFVCCERMLNKLLHQ